tara:strand:+ start:502 stop:648 length:147 start_codon:yes stop_codon:yes gene_type:complete
MNKIEDIEVGMKIMIIKDGKYQDSGLVIDISKNQIAAFEVVFGMLSDD